MAKKPEDKNVIKTIGEDEKSQVLIVDIDDPEIINIIKNKLGAKFHCQGIKPESFKSQYPDILLCSEEFYFKRINQLRSYASSELMQIAVINQTDKRNPDIKFPIEQGYCCKTRKDLVKTK